MNLVKPVLVREALSILGAMVLAHTQIMAVAGEPPTARPALIPLKVTV